MTSLHDVEPSKHFTLAPGLPAARVAEFAGGQVRPYFAGSKVSDAPFMQ